MHPAAWLLSDLHHANVAVGQLAVGLSQSTHMSHVVLMRAEQPVWQGAHPQAASEGSGTVPEEPIGLQSWCLEIRGADALFGCDFKRFEASAPWWRS